MLCEVCGERETSGDICRPCERILQDEDQGVSQFLRSVEPEVKEYMGFMSLEMRDVSEE